MPILIWFIWILKQGGRQSRQKKKFRNIHAETPLEMEYQSRKIRTPKEWEEREPVRVKRDWIDSNHHVNNSYYVKTAYNELPRMSL